MHTALRIASAMAVALTSASFMADDAKAQRYGGDGGSQSVYCASNDTRGTRCQMPWRDSVLLQQLSKTSCVEGQTWGRDPYSVWIKGGCRGNFGDARAYGRPGYGPGPGQEVYCASNDNRGNRCQMPWRYSVLSRQMSDAGCIEGRTWGSDPYSVWVKGGCRGQFRDARDARPHW